MVQILSKNFFVPYQVYIFIQLQSKMILIASAQGSQYRNASEIKLLKEHVFLHKWVNDGDFIWPHIYLNGDLIDLNEHVTLSHIWNAIWITLFQMIASIYKALLLNIYMSKLWLK